MADGMKDIIKRLEQQKAAIDRALSALRAVDGVSESGGGSAAPDAAPVKRRGRRKGGMTTEGRKRLSEALKARWAAKRAEPSAPAAAKKAKKRASKKA
ncbi:MAG: hypothetical protein ABJC09_13435 [Terriglobia bacterium]